MAESESTAERPGQAEQRDAGCTSMEGSCLTDFFRLLGRAHVLPILHLMIHESPAPRRFVELQNRLGISPNTLTDRLKELVEAGLLTRTAYSEIPPRVDYEATAKARELAHVFEAMCDWACEFDLATSTAAPSITVKPLAAGKGASNAKVVAARPTITTPRRAAQRQR